MRRHTLSVLQRTTREHFDVLELTEVSAVPAEMVVSKTGVEDSPVTVHGTTRVIVSVW